MLLLLALPLLALSAQAQVPKGDNLLTDLLEDLERRHQLQDYQDYQYSDYPGEPPATAPRALHQAEAGQEQRQGKQVKSSMLPAYCDPPNPCPLGYTAQDGCIEQFENNSEFSQKYQASQRCMCDTEHMFSCPEQMGKEQEQELSFMTLPEELTNPFLSGAKLPIAAKKGF